MSESTATPETEKKPEAAPVDAASADPVAELEAQLKAEKEKYLYLYAEFENYKKRVVKERSDLIKFGWEGVARELLGVVDNLDRAIEHMPQDVDANLRTGIEMVRDQFHKSMQKSGVAPITTIGQPFNPELHEAMGQEPSDQPNGTVTQQLTSGYTLHGRLLRPARVVVSMGRPAAT